MNIQDSIDVLGGIMINKQKELDALRMAVAMLQTTYAPEMHELDEARAVKARMIELEAEVAILKAPKDEKITALN